MGTYDNSFDNDIPELNKCPKCGAFFDGEICPICGEYCPPEMRAGNRKKKKPDEKYRPVKGASLKPFYLRWWFIILVSLISKIAGVILTLMTDWKKWQKALMICLVLSSYIVIGISSLVTNFATPLLEKTDYALSGMNLGLTEEEYKDMCTENADYTDMCDGTAEIGEYIEITAEMQCILGENGYYRTMYLCKDGDNYYVLVNYGGDGEKLKTDGLYTVYGRLTGTTLELINGTTATVPVIYYGYAEAVE